MRVRCPQCREYLRVPDTPRAERARCPGCKSVFRIGEARVDNCRPPDDNADDFDDDVDDLDDDVDDLYDDELDDDDDVDDEESFLEKTDNNVPHTGSDAEPDLTNLVVYDLLPGYRYLYRTNKNDLAVVRLAAQGLLGLLERKQQWVISRRHPGAAYRCISNMLLDSAIWLIQNGTVGAAQREAERWMVSG